MPTPTQHSTGEQVNPPTGAQRAIAVVHGALTGCRIIGETDEREVAAAVVRSLAHEPEVLAMLLDEIPSGRVPDDAVYPCTVCGGNVVVHARDIDFDPGDVIGGYVHFGCMKARS